LGFFYPAVTAMLILQALLVASCDAALRHRYSFNEGVTANATNRTIIDSISSANGIVRGNGASANAVQLILNGGSSETAAYVDLPNGIISTLTDATFEAWYTIDTAQSWARVFDFGSTSGGELTGPGGAGEGQDFIMYAASRGNNIDQQRAEIRNNDPLFGPGGSAGTAGAISTMNPEFNHSLDLQYHVALVFDADGGNDPGEATMTLYINGALPPGEAANPMETMVQLQNLNDVNNWLGRSNWANDENLDGSFNEFRIYDTALSAGQIAANVAAGPDVVPVLEIISLEVNSVTGSVTIKSNVATPVNIDYYTITSAAGALDTAGWNSLADQNIDAVGAGEGQSWDEADQSNEFSLAELFLLGASDVSSTSPLALGRAFDVSAFGPGVNGDLQFQYARQGDGGLTTGMVTYVTPPPVAGDYNHNGTVDAADYVVWLNTFGSSIADADGDGDGIVDQDDYSVWRSAFGNTAGAAATVQTSSVPEANSVLVLMTACIWNAAWCRARRRSGVVE
jgi:hypothetical protein